MNKKSKDARLCVSKEINRKKEKHLIRIMRSVFVILIVILSMNCISSFNYKLDYKLPESKGEKLEPIILSHNSIMIGDTFNDAGFWGTFAYNRKEIKSPLFLEKQESKYYIQISADDFSLVTLVLSFSLIFPYFNFYSEKPIYVSIYGKGNQGWTYKVGTYSGYSFSHFLLTPIYLFKSSSQLQDKNKKEKLVEEIAPIAYYILKEQMAKDAIEPISTPANNNNPSTPTSGFTDTVVLKNGDFIENVKATVTVDSLIVTDANGKTTVYKKSQVLTVKKK